MAVPSWPESARVKRRGFGWGLVRRMVRDTWVRDGIGTVVIETNPRGSVQHNNFREKKRLIEEQKIFRASL